MKCAKNNHFAVVCKGDSKKQDQYSVAVCKDEAQSEEEVLTVDKVSAINSNQQKNKIFARLTIEDKDINFQIDTGATCNILLIGRLNSDYEMVKQKQSLSMYNGTTMQAIGKQTVNIKNPKNDKTYQADFIIVEDNTMVQKLGAKMAQLMELISVNHQNIAAVVEVSVMDNVSSLTVTDVLSEYQDVFEKQGCFEGLLHLEIDNTVAPVKMPIRKFPLAIRDEIKNELDNLVNRGIIQPVDVPTEWVSCPIIVKKPSGKLRVCLDPKPLNQALKCCHYPLPVIDDLLPRLNNAKVFSVCDVKDGFWHVQLDEESSFLTTFGTPFGEIQI